MPAIGVRPPFFTFVAVLAIAPVAGIPPKNGVTTFAIPCEINSVFERWFDPIIPSATTAESNDSMPPNRAIVSAGAIYIDRLLKSKFGMLKLIVLGIVPKKDSIVETGISATLTMAVMAIMAIMVEEMETETAMARKGHLKHMPVTN